jgi:hypothetical protein
MHLMNRKNHRLLQHNALTKNKIKAKIKKIACELNRIEEITTFTVCKGICYMNNVTITVMHNIKTYARYLKTKKKIIKNSGNISNEAET